MDDGDSLRGLISKHQENAGAAAAISLLWAMAYSVVKRLDIRGALMAAGVGSLGSATLWVFVSEFLNVTIIMLVPIAAACGVGAFPLLRAWTRKDDQFADGVVDSAGGFIGRWLKRLTGGA